ncbi:MAG: hypothetical protein WDA16_06470 [Candidatus Thermoplasmatota archaeon]
MRIRRRLLLSIVVAAVAALSLTAIVVGSSPGTFFDLTDAHGEAKLVLDAPSPAKLILIAAIIVGLFSASFILLMRTPRFPLVASLLLIVAVQSVVYVSFSLYSFHEEPEFCARTCHVMEPLVQTLETPGQNRMMMAHAENGTVLCLDCHSSPGPAGQVLLIKTSLRHVWVSAVSRDFNASNLGGPDPLHTVPDVFCLKCHSANESDPLPPTHASQDSKCALCHNPHAKEGVGTDVPAELFTQEACVGCHEDAANRLQDPPTKHKDVGSGDCRTCHAGHHVNLTEYPDAIPSCSAYGCHDQDPDNNVSLAAIEHAKFNTTECGDCHGLAHDLKAPPQEALAASCTECHVKAAQPLRDSPTRHTQLVSQQGCESCHEKHADPPPTCDKAGCHDQDPANNMSLVSLEHATFDSTRPCADCHGTAHDLTQPSFDVIASECAKCHAENAQRIQSSLTAHGNISNSQPGCAQCHTQHDPPTIPACTDAKCHDQDPENPASLIRRSHPTFDTTRVCSECHGIAHDLKPPPTDVLRKSCTECHATQAQPLRDYPSRHTSIAFTSGCDACHSGKHSDPPPACGKAGCHDQDPNNTASLARIKHSSFENGRPCADCHGIAHNLTRPSLEILATECAKCHADDAQRVQSSLTSHGNIANGKPGCVQCHVSHDPPSIPACTDAKCHGATAPVGNIPNANHAAFPADTCGGCHGTSHNLRMPSPTALAPNCAKCHVAQAAKLNASGTAHLDLAKTKGCATCHSDHVEGGGPKACTDVGCHDTAAKGLAHVPHPAVASTQCSDCHGKAHDLHTPTAEAIAAKCATCHQTNATVILASKTKHADIARDGQCTACHKQHGTLPPPACTDAGCHDQNANNSASLVKKGHVPAPGGGKCADCHGTAHDVKRPAFTKILPYCADCHSATAAKVRGSPAAHGAIARDAGCGGCHITHDAPSAAGDAKACTSSGCHDQDPANNASLVKKKHAEIPNCLGCHGDPHTPRQPAFSELGSACASCHAENATKIAQEGLGHANVAAAGCQNCHKTHASTNVPGAVLGCRDAGCHDTNASNPASLVARNHKDFGSVQTCQKCHEGRHNLTIPTFAGQCTTCHAGKTLVSGEPHTTRDPRALEPACSSCHSLEPLSGETRERADHASATCPTCHNAANTTGVPMPNYSPASTVSQLKWQRDVNKAEKAGWVERGNHTSGADCAKCHRWHDSTTPAYPPGGCDPSCHSWLGTIDEQGFTSGSGADTHYPPKDPKYPADSEAARSPPGSVKPAVLLSVSKDLDGDFRDHKGIYDKWGCTGFCHNPAMTVETAEAWGVPLDSSKPSVEPQGLQPGTEHGFINKCTDCHGFSNPAFPPPEGRGDLHKTHIPFIQGEKPVADFRQDAPKSACTYCHNDDKSKSGDIPVYGGCYNCHLSGHRPETYYWAAE